MSETRCSATFAGERCVLLDGHSEAHRITFRDGEEAPVMVDLLGTLNGIARMIEQVDLREGRGEAVNWGGVAGNIESVARIAIARAEGRR